MARTRSSRRMGSFQKDQQQAVLSNGNSECLGAAGVCKPLDVHLKYSGTTQTARKYSPALQTRQRPVSGDGYRLYLCNDRSVSKGLSRPNISCTVVSHAPATFHQKATSFQASLLHPSLLRTALTKDSFTNRFKPPSKFQRLQLPRITTTVQTATSQHDFTYLSPLPRVSEGTPSSYLAVRLSSSKA